MLSELPVFTMSLLCAGRFGRKSKQKGKHLSFYNLIHIFVLIELNINSWTGPLVRILKLCVHGPHTTHLSSGTFLGIS